MPHPKQPPDKGGRSPTGEDAELQRIGRRLKERQGGPPPGEIWSGDDAAVVAGPGADGSPVLLLTTDAVVGGVHVDLSLATLADVGWKALTVAVSDIAAMGGVPGRALVALSAPVGTDVDELAVGVAEAAERWACPVVGGDLTASDQLVVAVTVTGGLSGPGPAVLRSGAHPGDALLVTGPLGGSAAGLRRLRSGDAPEDLAASYRRPLARLAEGRVSRDASATAMLDVSDGLGLDLHRLADASGVGFALDSVPVRDGATLEEAIGGGEDYELLIATGDPDRLAEAFGAAGLRAPVRIGECVREETERSLAGDELPASGYQHRF
ncbi:MAG: thiamine-phosphate kinase [Acidimicrobiales bacterium]